MAQRKPCVEPPWLGHVDLDTLHLSAQGVQRAAHDARRFDLWTEVAGWHGVSSVWSPSALLFDLNNP